MTEKGVFPKKGWRKVDGEWVAPLPPPPPAPKFQSEDASDRRKWANKMAGWPVKGK